MTSGDTRKASGRAQGLKQGHNLGLWLPIIRAFEEFSVGVIDGIAIRAKFAFIAVHDDIKDVL